MIETTDRVRIVREYPTTPTPNRPSYLYEVAILPSVDNPKPQLCPECKDSLLLELGWPTVGWSVERVEGRLAWTILVTADTPDPVVERLVALHLDPPHPEHGPHDHRALERWFGAKAASDLTEALDLWAETHKPHGAVAAEVISAAEPLRAAALVLRERFAKWRKA